jgi:hypothetical protein
MASDARAVVVLPTPRAPAKRMACVDAALRDRVAERAGDVLLTRDVIEGLGRHFRARTR